MNDWRILFKLTTRERGKLALRCVDSIFKHCESSNFDVLISIDYDDESPDSIVQLLSFRADKKYNNVHFRCGNSINKVDAINRDIKDYPFDWDILVNVSDDQYFIKKGFDNFIREQFEHRDMVLHLPDDNRKDLMTMSIIGYDYYQRDGYVYHPSYEGQFCDDEAQAVAKERGCYKFVDELVFVHAHRNYGKAEDDASYRKYDALFTKDRNNYQVRQKNNFYL